MSRVLCWMYGHEWVIVITAKDGVHIYCRRCPVDARRWLRW